MGGGRGDCGGEIIFCITKPPSFVGRRSSVGSSSSVRPSLGSFVRSFVSKWACTRFYQLCGPTSLARSLVRSLSRSKGEKEGRVIHAKRCHHLSRSTFHPARSLAPPLTLLLWAPARFAVLNIGELTD